MLFELDFEFGMLYLIDATSWNGVVGGLKQP